MQLQTCCLCVELREGSKALGLACLAAHTVGLVRALLLQLDLVSALCHVGLAAAAALLLYGAISRKRAFLVTDNLLVLMDEGDKITISPRSPGWFSTESSA